MGTMAGWAVGIAGVCIGNTLWLAGLILFLLGVWGVMVKKESIMKIVGMMSLTSGGKPRGFALKLKGLVDPADRRKTFGGMMLILGAVLLIIGSALVYHFAG